MRASMRAPACPTRSTSRLTGADLRAALDTLHLVGAASRHVDGFARAGVANLPRLVSSELTTLSVCDLHTGHRSVVSDHPGAISAAEIAVFDRYFHDHPLVRAHGGNPSAVTRRIGDVMSPGAFLLTPLFNEYYRPILIDHVIAMPIHVDHRFLVSFVLNRRGRDFSDRERALLDVLRPHLGDLYRLSLVATPGMTEEHGPSADAAVPRTAVEAAALSLPVTAREREVLHWLAMGKTDRDIGEILAISPRTVHKHLQRIYEKLGVETRTAAVMRVLAGHRPTVADA